MNREYRNGTAIHSDATITHCPLSGTTAHDWIVFTLGRACRYCQMVLSNREWDHVTGDTFSEKGR